MKGGVTWAGWRILVGALVLMRNYIEEGAVPSKINMPNRKSTFKICLQLNMMSDLCREWLAWRPTSLLGFLMFNVY